MADKCICKDEAPSFMAQLLKELGWNEGTRIPLANDINKELETLLIKRQNEIQRLKEEISTQEEKTADLNNYKQHVKTEYQENTRLLFAHKQQMEQEVKLIQMSSNEAVTLERDAAALNKQTNDMAPRVDRLQNEIGRLLKKADVMKGDICGEKGTLQEWRAQLDRNAGDIAAIEQFKKQDISKAKALETKRQKLKVEHDKMHERLVHLVGNLTAEERACERISVQVKEGMEQRKELLQMWTEAIENLRQRDTDIRHIREDYAVLEAAAVRVTDQCREQEAFCEQQRGNNDEAERENAELAHRIAKTRLALQRILHDNVTLDSEAKTLQREMQNMQLMLEKLHMENKRIMEEQHKKDMAIKDMVDKIKELKEKILETQDKTKSSEKRAKELEDILNEEEKYASQLTVSQQRGMHCSFVEQQKLSALKNEDKIFSMQIRSAKTNMTKLDARQKAAEKNLQIQQETIYGIVYRTEITGARVAMLEGAISEPVNEAELNACEARLKEVLARHTARMALLERHTAKLHDDMRRLARDLDRANTDHAKLKSRLKSSLLKVEGGTKELKEWREAWRQMRVEEALLRLRVAHARRALAGLDGTAFSLDQQRLKLDAALKERLVEIDARRDMFDMNRRALSEACGKLTREVRERECRIVQLKKRYDIFIGSLGKDENGQNLAPSFFKIKFAEERANLREKGAALDAEIGRCEKQISALEATRAVMQAAHKHFIRKITPLAEDTPEMQELRSLMSQYYELRDSLKELVARQSDLEQTVGELSDRRQQLGERTESLRARETDAETELEAIRERVATQQSRLENARAIVRHYLRRAKILVDDPAHWRTFQMALWVRDYADAAYSALRQLTEMCADAPHCNSRLAALLSATDVENLLIPSQRRLKTFIQRIVNGAERHTNVGCLSTTDGAESVFSTSTESSHSGLSMASGHTRRITGFRRTLAGKISEPALADAIPEATMRSTVSLRVVTVGLEERVSDADGNLPIKSPISRKSFR